MKVVLNAQCMENRKEAHAYLKEKLNFPDYYGNNLDALYDCLTDLTDTEVVFENVDIVEGYFEKVYRVFLKAGEENDGLEINEIPKV